MDYIIGIDFDGTVVTHEYPRVGRDIGAVPVLKRLVESGNRLILFTMRSKKNGTLQDAENWFKQNGIKLYGVNTNPTQKEWTDSPKAHCHIYIDDAALGIPKKYDRETGRAYVDWKRVEELLEDEGVFYDDSDIEQLLRDYANQQKDNVNEIKKKNMKKINETQLRNMIAKSVKKVLNEGCPFDINQYKAIVQEAYNHIEEANKLILEAMKLTASKEDPHRSCGTYHFDLLDKADRALGAVKSNLVTAGAKSPQLNGPGFLDAGQEYDG